MLELSIKLVEVFYRHIFSFFVVYMNNMKFFTFSMSINLPSLSKYSNRKIPLYLKLVPRGEISSVKSDISFFELLSVERFSIRLL
jgi:hypothetical protein